MSSLAGQFWPSSSLGCKVKMLVGAGVSTSKELHWHRRCCCWWEILVPCHVDLSVSPWHSSWLPPEQAIQQQARQNYQILLWPGLEIPHRYFCDILLFTQGSPIQWGRGEASKYQEEMIIGCHLGSLATTNSKETIPLTYFKVVSESINDRFALLLHPTSKIGKNA